MHARRALLPLALCTAYLYVHCAARPPVPRSAVEEDMPSPAEPLAAVDAPRTLDELKQRIEAIAEREHIAGVAFALVGADGPIYAGGVGVRDRATRTPMDGDTVFRVGSLSKSVIALGVMRLVDQGKLSIDRPLREILPDLGIENPWEAESPVTLAQCLEHTAGLDDVRFNEIFTDDERLSVEATLAINPRSRQIRWRPGTRHAYSNVGYTIAARAIEVASAEPFDTYLHREILAPLGITEADFRRTELLSARLASGYMRGDDPIVFRPFAHRPSASLLASASDLAKLAHFWIVRGEGYPQVVSRAGLERIEQSGTLPYPHLASDYGFANYGDVMHPVISRGHDGGMPGFHASFRYIPELGIGYALLLNSNYTFRGYFEIRSLLFGYLTAGRSFPPPPPPGPVERPAFDYYVLENPRNEIFGFIDRVRGGWSVSDLGDHLHLRELSGETFDVVAGADGGYRDPDHCGSLVQFTANRDGTQVMLLSFLYTEPASAWFAHARYVAIGFAMALLRYAPLWAIAALAIGAMQRRRILPGSLLLAPALAGLSCFAIPHLLDHAFFSGVIGIVHPITIALCGATILFGVASVATLVVTIHWARRPDRPSRTALLFPMMCGLCFTPLAIWVAMNGWIGIRTWAF